MPRQLPADIVDFTGRGTELAALEQPRDDVVAAAATVVITGPAGVGKTTLAVHASHRLVGSYPDGQLFIDLQGFTPMRKPVGAGVALERLLLLLGVSGERIPKDVDDRSAMWRSVLADRRMLIVLDNAAGPEQIVPLLPGTAGCLVLVTSRRSLVGLPVAGAVPLDMLPVGDAVTLFSRTAARPSGSLSEPPELVREAVDLCGRLPLAIRVASARLRAHPSWRLADLVARLEGGRRLAELDSGAGAGDVSAAIDMSYRQLAPALRHCYRLLGVHPGRHFEPYATAALLRADVSVARRLLEQLLDVHLLQEPVPERYAFHDLVRDHAVWAAVQAQRGSRGRRRSRAALTRLLDHYRHAASVAMDVARPYERGRRPTVPPAVTPLPDLSTPDKATRWLDAELPNLLAAARWAAANGLPHRTWQLSVITSGHLDARGRFQDAEDLNRRALFAARASGHRAGELAALIGLGSARTSLSRYRDAIDDFQRALEIAAATGDRLAEADALAGLGRVYVQEARYERAVEILIRLLETARTARDRTGELNALRGLGFVNTVQGRYQPALDNYRDALQIARATGNRLGELSTLAHIGMTHRQMGELDRARQALSSSLGVAEQISALEPQLKALVGLAHIDRMLGHLPQALANYQRAHDIAKGVGYRVVEVSTLVGVGLVRQRQSQYEEAAGLFGRVLSWALEAGDRNWQYEALQRRGRLHHLADEQHDAVAVHRQALDLAIELDQPPDQVRAHDGLAYAHRALGEFATAQEHWQRALHLLTTLHIDHTVEEEASVAAIKRQLAELDESRTGTDGE